MKLPRQIKINGMTWKISRKKSIKLEGADCYGLCDPEAKTIYLLSELKDDELTRYFIHEYCHAVMHELGFQHTSISEDLEDMLVDAIAREMTKSFKLMKR